MLELIFCSRYFVFFKKNQNRQTYIYTYTVLTILVGLAICTPKRELSTNEKIA